MQSRPFPQRQATTRQRTKQKRKAVENEDMRDFTQRTDLQAKDGFDECSDGNCLKHLGKHHKKYEAEGGKGEKRGCRD